MSSNKRSTGVEWLWTWGFEHVYKYTEHNSKILLLCSHLALLNCCFPNSCAPLIATLIAKNEIGAWHQYNSNPSLILEYDALAAAAYTHTLPITFCKHTSAAPAWCWSAKYSVKAGDSTRVQLSRLSGTHSKIFFLKLSIESKHGIHIPAL